MGSLYFFNPGCELEVANGSKNYNLQKFPQILENDLRTLPMFFAKKNDTVLINKPIENTFINTWKDRFCTCFMTEDEIKKQDKKFEKFIPWGISPRAFHLVEGMNFSDNFYKNGFENKHKKLFSRESSADFCKKFYEEFPFDEIFPKKNELPFIARTVEEATLFFKEKFSEKALGAVFKAPFASSGRGVRIFRNDSLTDNILQWTGFVIKTQGAVECETFFDRKQDFSMHYKIEGKKIEFKGMSLFETADNGFYLSSRIGKFFNELPLFNALNVKQLAEYQTKILEKTVYTENYSGNLGIDCMVYSQNGSFKLNPCVEINCRNSMGALAMNLEDFIEKGSKCSFHVFQKQKSAEMLSKKPQIISGKLKSGFLSLTPQENGLFAAGILAEEI